MSVGIICEFNPFHKGHRHLIDTVKNDKSIADNTVICIMSGNFVQRGELAICDKFTRAKTAIENGADLVIELPCIYSLMSAEGFAKYSVQILESTGVVDMLAFGAECDDISRLKATAAEIESKKEEIIREMKSGVSYPTARKNVISNDILDYPNNILAIEYIKHTSLPCTAVKRIGKGHDTDDNLYSASAIRNQMSLDDICSLKNCEKAVLARLRTMSREDFSKIEDVTEGLENRIYEAVKSSLSLDELYDSIKTKRYTHSRIRRIILKAYLGITEDYIFDAPYIRILG
ncbi:MAG: nucleotidyltransferase family protein, partial [Eubacterium sp.]